MKKSQRRDASREDWELDTLTSRYYTRTAIDYSTAPANVLLSTLCDALNPMIAHLAFRYEHGLP